MTTRILALEKDLFFAVRMRDTLRRYDMEVVIARTLSAFIERLTVGDEADERAALVIVNIASKGVDWAEAIRQARAQHYPVLAFGSHMDLDARAVALQAGAQRVVANSKFASDMPALVQRMLINSTIDPVEDDEAAH